MTINPRARLLYNNHAAGDGVTATASGAVVGYPASNAFDPALAKTWLDPGTFVIDATNDKLYVNDGGDKTATLTHGTYAGGSALASHVTTQLNAVSSSWTCSYGSYTFTIGRAGGGTKILRLSQTTAAAWDTLGFVGSVDTAAGTGLDADEPRNHTSVTMHWDLGVAREVRAFIAIAAAGMDFPISSSATVTLKANSVDDFSAPPLSVTLAATARGIHKFLDDIEDTTYRYWKWEFRDRLNTNGPTSFAISYVYLGDYHQLVSSNVDNGFRRTLVDPSVKTRSQGGTVHARRKTKYWRYESMVVDFLSRDEREDLEAVLLHLGQTESFFLALDPTAEISDSVGEFTKFMQLSEDSELEHVLYDMFRIRLACDEVI